MFPITKIANKTTSCLTYSLAVFKAFGETRRRRRSIHRQTSVWLDCVVSWIYDTIKFKAVFSPITKIANKSTRCLAYALAAFTAIGTVGADVLVTDKQVFG